MSDNNDNEESDLITDEPIEEEQVSVSEEEKIPRIPWKSFLRNQFRKFIGTIIILALMVYIIKLSDKINPDRTEINPQDIISVSDLIYIQLIITSSIVYLLILGFFTKIVFFDHKQDFGIESYKSINAVIFLALTISFISVIYILFDVALINIYLVIAPVYLIWSLRSEYNLSYSFITKIPEQTDRLAYSEIRSGIFIVLLMFMLFIPLIMTIVIMTRFGRKQLLIKREKPTEKMSLGDWLKFLIIIPIEGVLFMIYVFLVVLDIASVLQILLLLTMIIIIIIFILRLFIIVFKILIAGRFVIYSNLSMIVPIILLFYILPAMLWATWDMFIISTSNTLTNTIYEIYNGSIDLDPSDPNFAINKLTQAQFLKFYMQTIGLNLGNILRILELDFVLIVGLSSLIIGYAEGYSLFAIIRSIATGVSIARTGRVAQKSAPRMVVLSSRLIFLSVWLGLLWDKFLILWGTLSFQFNLPLPNISLPRIFEKIFNFSISLADLGGIFIALSLLIVPLYFIITSSFKFLSVSLVVEKVKDDTQAFFFFISSAFILIIAQILADIAALPEFENKHGDFLPLSGTATESILPFVSKIFETVEAIGFYAGAIVALLLLIKYLLLRLIGRNPELFS